MKSLVSARPIALALVLALVSHLAAPSAVIARQERAAAGAEAVLPDGTEITVITIDEISSKTAAEGDPLSFKIDEDVLVSGKTVIKAGTLVKGSVSNASKSGRLGKGGQLSIRIESTTAVDGQKVRLRAVKGKEGDDKTGTTVALAVLFGPLGFLKKGKNAVIKPNTRIKAFIDEEKKIKTSSEQ